MAFAADLPCCSCHSGAAIFILLIQGVTLQAGCSLKDTAVGPDYMVPENSEHREAMLAKSRPANL